MYNVSKFVKIDIIYNKQHEEKEYCAALSKLI